MAQLICHSPAKLNLMLHITGRRADGYHDLQTIFQRIDFMDTLGISIRHDGQIDIESTPDIADNLVMRAAKLLQETTQCALGCHIQLTKRIPMGAGLGGGSSNAATTLIALNQLWHLQLTTAQLMSLGLKLGADVPFFIYGHSCWAEGIGEQFQPLKLPLFHYVVLIPDVYCSTQRIFNHPALPRCTAPLTAPTHHMTTDDLALYHNDCQNLSCTLYPPIQAALDYLAQFGLARMTGTGSAVFLVHDGTLDALSILKNAPCQGIICQALDADYTIINPHVAKPI